MVYAYAAACWLGIQTYREPGWARREAKYCPRDPGLFDAPAPPPDEPAPVRVTRAAAAPDEDAAEDDLFAPIQLH